MLYITFTLFIDISVKIVWRCQITSYESVEMSMIWW